MKKKDKKKINKRCAEMAKMIVKAEQLFAKIERESPYGKEKIKSNRSK